MARPGLILDRDGTLTHELGYLSSQWDLVPVPGVEVAMRRVRAAGIPVAVVTNQSAVSRGIVSELGLERMHDYLKRHFGVAAVYHCPHLPDGGCSCRKPLPELVSRAVRDLDLDARRSLMVGDHITDCQAARAAGVPAMLVRSGHGQGQEDEARADGFRVVHDLAQAVEIFLAGLKR